MLIHKTGFTFMVYDSDIIILLESYVYANPDVLANPDLWIEAMGWDQNLWKNWTGQFPSAVCTYDTLYLSCGLFSFYYFVVIISDLTCSDRPSH